MVIPEILCGESRPKSSQDQVKKLENLLQMFEGRAKSQVMEKLANTIEHSFSQSSVEEKLAGKQGLLDIVTVDELIEIVSLALEIFFHYDTEHTLKEIRETIEEVGKDIVEANKLHNPKEPKEHAQTEDHSNPHIYSSVTATIEPYLYIRTDAPLHPFIHSITNVPNQPFYQTVAPSSVQQYSYTYAMSDVYNLKWNGWI